MGRSRVRSKVWSKVWSRVRGARWRAWKNMRVMPSCRCTWRAPTPSRCSDERLRSRMTRPVESPLASGERLFSAEEVAGYLGVPVKTLFQWRYKGVGPRGLRVGRHVRYRSNDVEAWLQRVGDAERRGDVA